MALTADDVQRAAKLAKIKLTTPEIDSALTQLQSILGLIDRMQQVDTTDIEPMAHPLELTQTLRPDHVTEQNRREQFQSIAPAARDGLYTVPRVVE